MMWEHLNKIKGLAKTFFRSIAHSYKAKRPAIVAWLFFLLISLIVSLHIQKFYLFTTESPRIAAFALAFAPLLLIYNFSRLVMPRVSAMGLITVLTIALSVANEQKISLTTQPLSWSDISRLDRLLIAIKYATIGNIITLIILAALFGGALTLELKYRKTIPFSSWRKTRIAALITLFALSFYNYFELLDLKLGDAITSSMQTLGIRYVPWDRERNYRTNGLLLHIIQSARPKKIPKGNPAAEANLRSKIAKVAHNNSKIDQLILILCESCWYESNYFSSSFEPLRALGFSEWRAISPSYGGETVNASFEILTGLPSNNILNGVIYDEYADIMSDKVISIPQHFAENKSQTIAIHNYNKEFWSRHIVKPKLGFNRFIGLEDMRHNTPSGQWPKDSLLTDSAKNELNKINSEDSFFIFLVTVYTHGGYDTEPIGRPVDNGEYDYSTRLSESINTIANFVKKIRVSKPKASILILGDHKPPLSKMFWESQVIPRKYFVSTGSSNMHFVLNSTAPLSVIGDVPGFLLTPDPKFDKYFANIANNKTFYCLGQLIDKLMLDGKLPASNLDHSACNAKDFVPEIDRKKYPEWLYRLSLF